MIKEEMMPKNFERNEEESELSLVHIEQDPYGIYRREAVEIRQLDSRYAGIYRGLTNNAQLLIKPSIDWPASFVKEQVVVPFWDNRGALISYSSTLAVIPQSEEKLRNLVFEEEKKVGLMSDPACFI